jgi:hypothetical protein
MAAPTKLMQRSVDFGLAFIWVSFNCPPFSRFRILKNGLFEYKSTSVQHNTWTLSVHVLRRIVYFLHIFRFPDGHISCLCDTSRNSKNFWSECHVLCFFISIRINFNRNLSYVCVTFRSGKYENLILHRFMWVTVSLILFKNYFQWLFLEQI